MTHIEVIVTPTDPDDETPTGLTPAAAARLAAVLAGAGFRVVVGPSARPPSTVPGGGRWGHETKAGPIY